MKKVNQLYPDYSFFNTMNYFISNSNENEMIINFILENILSTNLCKKTGRKIERHYKILDIGGGSGFRTFSILNKIFATNKNQYILYNIEPYEIWDSYYKDNSRQIKKNSSEVCTIREFWENFSFQCQYDLILCVHSLYGINKWNSTIENDNTIIKMIKYLNSNGIIYIVHQSKNNFIYKLQKKYFKNPPFNNFRAISGEDIKEILRMFKVDFQTYSIPEVLTINHNSLSSNLFINSILSFMLQVKQSMYSIINDENRMNILNDLITNFNSYTKNSVCMNMNHLPIDIEDDIIKIVKT